MDFMGIFDFIGGFFMADFGCGQSKWHILGTLT